MLSLDQTLHACLVMDDGTLVMPLKWDTKEVPCDFRFFQIQMWDEEENPIPQPYPDPPEWDQPRMPGFWLIDLQNLPPGFSVVELSAEDWAETQVHKDAKRYDSTAQKVQVRDAYERNPKARDPRVCQLKNNVGSEVELSHYSHGGVPQYRIKQGSQKKEGDFPALDFTHVARLRKQPVSAVELKKKQALRATFMRKP